MLIVALGWSLLEAILKSKTEHIMGNCHHRGSAINKTFIETYIHTIGATVPVVKANYSSGNFSLGGTMSTGMTASDKNYCLLEDLGNSFGRVQMYPRALCLRVSVKEEDLSSTMDCGCMRGFNGYAPANRQPTYLDTPRERHVMHVSLTGLALGGEVSETSAELLCLAKTAKHVQCQEHFRF